MLDIPDAGDQIPALILAADGKQIKAYRKGGEVVTLTGDAMKFAAKMLDDKAPPNKRLKRGAIIRLYKDDKGAWQISQLPEVESAFVADDPKDGAIRALVGGFDFNRNKFNHVTQAWRQPVRASSLSSTPLRWKRATAPAALLPTSPSSFQPARPGPSGRAGRERWG